MSNVTCNNCGAINDCHVRVRANQRTAYCNKCGKYIKNIAYMPAKFYTGKYKDMLVSEVNDAAYLLWFLDNVSRITPALREAIDKQIVKLREGVA